MHDVIVIGAGPAGNLAAARLATMGYRVAVLDWRRNIGDKLCTGIIGTECVERFPPDEQHVHHRARTATVVSPAGKRYRIVKEQTQALVIDRVAYVSSLADRAMEAGAEYELGARVAGVELSGREATVSVRANSGQRRYRTELVILASGFGSPLLRMVGLQNGGPHDSMVGCQAEVETHELEDTEVYLGDEIAPGSFGWLVPLYGSRALIGIMSRQKLNGRMDRFLSRARELGKVRDLIITPQRWGIPLRPLSRTYGERVLVVGDAAGLAKPTTGGGIYYALLSGEIAASTANEALLAGDFSARRLKRYEKRWRAALGREMRIGLYARKLYEGLRDGQIERLLGALVTSEAQDEVIHGPDFSFDWHGRAILEAVGHRDVGPLVRSFGPMVTPLLSRLRSAGPFS